MCFPIHLPSLMQTHSYAKGARTPPLWFLVDYLLFSLHGPCSRCRSRYVVRFCRVREQPSVQHAHSCGKSGSGAAAAHGVSPGQVRCDPPHLTTFLLDADVSNPPPPPSSPPPHPRPSMAVQLRPCVKRSTPPPSVVAPLRPLPPYQPRFPSYPPSRLVATSFPLLP